MTSERTADSGADSAEPVEAAPSRRIWQSARVIPIIIIALIAALFGGLMAYSRSLSHDPAAWHVDPLTAAKPTTPNSYRVGPDGTTEPDADAPTFSVDAGVLGAAFDTVAMNESAVERLAGSPGDGWVTYVQRSTLFGFPDYISVRFIDVDGGGSTLAVFSRSRLGQSDLGVNKKRVEDWLAKLTAAIG